MESLITAHGITATKAEWQAIASVYSDNQIGQSLRQRATGLSADLAMARLKCGHADGRAILTLVEQDRADDVIRSADYRARLEAESLKDLAKSTREEGGMELLRKLPEGVRHAVVKYL
jgi:dTDP-4-dehydrorhamnose reductase